MTIMIAREIIFPTGFNIVYPLAFGLWRENVDNDWEVCSKCKPQGHFLLDYRTILQKINIKGQSNCCGTKLIELFYELMNI